MEKKVKKAETEIKSNVSTILDLEKIKPISNLVFLHIA